ncbi:small glutamine-rich tetratricopeptide repeat-containing protein 2 [Zea mays]|nr:small glutamine-rich tetratricopeptide repeat-containing protein 2 [Zea mays]|eukprot:XP_008680501.1 small glutamine-rich tetratricopeptide repeat-containing protein 2 [Zea mays]
MPRSVTRSTGAARCPHSPTRRACVQLPRSQVDHTSVPGSAAVFDHGGTAARGAQLLEHLLGPTEFDAAVGLTALATREKAEAALEKGNTNEAEALLTEVIGFNACGGLHLVHMSRSKARLEMGDIPGALGDAEEAIRIAPRFPQAHLLRGDALFAMGEYSVAEDAYADALDLDPSIRRSKSFRARLERLREKLVSANNP